MAQATRDRRFAPGWWTLILFVVVIGLIVMTAVFFTGSYKSYDAVTLTSDRSGLVMEQGAKVKYHGVQVGEVGTIEAQGGPGDKTSLQLRISPDQMSVIPANVIAQIRSTTAFGAKYVDLSDPGARSSRTLASGAVLQSGNVTTEVNTVFENLTDVLHRIDPTKLNAVLSAVGTGLRGQGDKLGQTISDSDTVLKAVNPKLPRLQSDLKSLTVAGNAYSGAAQNILAVLRNTTTISNTVTAEQKNLESVLLATIGLSDAGTDLIGKNKRNLVDAINILEPTTNLLYKYNPEYTCLLQGAKWYLDNGGYAATGGYDHSTVRLDAGLLFGDNPYKFPQNLPKVNGKGGPGGKPGCGSLPDPSKNFPVKQVITDTGWGINPGDVQTKPQIGNPAFVEFLFGTAKGRR